MYDMHQKMSTFYHQYVQLRKDKDKGKDKKRELAEHRNANLDRLKRGLDKLGQKDDQTYRYPVDHCDQGSYAMDTLNQRPNSDYDIDVAIIFRKDDLPSAPADARKQVARAFEQLPGNYKRPPEARTNAVTIAYEEGYHIDFAVYREYQDAYDDTIREHAGAEWKVRDPQAITQWFKDQVKELSPADDQCASVKPGQLRRVVRLLKMFARSRSSWNLPGGMIITKLVVECYWPDPDRDDVALYHTMQAIYDRLDNNFQVFDPIEWEQQLTYKEKYITQVKRLREKLDEALEHLRVLFQQGLEEDEAMMMNAWYQIFLHDFWKPAQNEDDETSAKRGPSIMTGGGSRSNVRESPPFA